MEDVATAEISRTQVWQWIKHGASLVDGRGITAELFNQLLAEELAKIKQEVGDARYAGGHFALASELFEDVHQRGLYRIFDAARLRLFGLT